MVRRYRRYRRRRTYSRKKRWTPYSSEVTIVTAGANLAANNFIELGTVGVFGSSPSIGNGAAASSPVSAINYYACRCRFKGVIVNNVPSGISYIVYIGFVPNAVVMNNNAQQNDALYGSYFYKHPEYILAWTRLDNLADTGDTGEVSLYSRITKRVCSGDTIVVGCLIKNSTAGALATSNVTGTFSCYLRTN